MWIRSLPVSINCPTFFTALGWKIAWNNEPERRIITCCRFEIDRLPHGTGWGSAFLVSFLMISRFSSSSFRNPMRVRHGTNNRKCQWILRMSTSAVRSFSRPTLRSLPFSAAVFSVSVRARSYLKLPIVNELFSPTICNFQYFRRILFLSAGVAQKCPAAQFHFQEGVTDHILYNFRSGLVNGFRSKGRMSKVRSLWSMRGVRRISGSRACNVSELLREI